LQRFFTGLLSEYPAAGRVAARAAAEAAANGTETIFKTGPGPSPRDLEFLIRPGRRSWLEWWQERLMSRKATKS